MDMACWQLECMLAVGDAITLTESLDELCSVSCFEDEEDHSMWRVRAFATNMEMVSDIKDIMVKTASNLGYPALQVSIEHLAHLDWVSETQKRFKPFTVGAFYIHSSYYNDAEKPLGYIPIEVDAQMAFGTGEHETTHGCLLALSDLKQKGFIPKKVLDMGCGSGILAIAAAKLWPDAYIVAADIELPSVEITTENMRINSVPNPCTIIQSNGYEAKEIVSDSPYDLIMANILAAPLISMAGDVKLHLAQEGVCVLSGLLQIQEEDVLTAHQAQDLTLRYRYPKGDWVSLVCGK
jgi:ribosomal protein L11 methyltransferase